MKNRIGVIVLLIIGLGLGIAFITVKKQASDQRREDAETIGALSNKWLKTTADLDDQRQVNATLEKDLDSQKKVFEQALGELTNNFSQVSSNLSQTEASLKANQEELARRDAKIGELEAQNQALDKKALDLSNAITNLTVQITDTQRKLVAAEGDKAFLQNELHRLMAEKAELERQFNDLTVLRAQVSKLKEELSIARRLEWIRQGVFARAEQKGAQQLMQGLSAQPAKAPKTTYDLNVEVSADGSVRVIQPSTNAAPATNPPPAK